MKRSRLTLCFLLLLLPLFVFGQKIKVVQGEYTFVADKYMSLEQAQRIALERAQIQAIADMFGTIVSQSTTSIVSNKDGVSNSDFFSLGSSDVKGEWIETIGTPEYKQGFAEGDGYWVKCTVRGRAREIVNAQIDLIAKVLRNGTEEKFESYEFKAGDDMFLYFKSPVNGYLAVYQIDEGIEKAYCLLPYSQSEDAVQVIKHDKPYVFFSRKNAEKSKAGIVDEYTMTCDFDTEYNDLYVIFSPNPFSKANSLDATGTLPRRLSWKDFHEWLAKARKRDNEMNVVKKMLTITK